MKDKSVKNQILLSFFGLIAVLAVCIFVLGYSIVQKQIIQRAQHQVDQYLESARIVYQAEIDRIGNAMKLVSYDQDLENLCKKMNLDYLFHIPFEQALGHPSEIVRIASKTKKSGGGSRIIEIEELSVMNTEIQNRTRITIRETDKARETDLTALDTAMAKEYAIPEVNSDGTVLAVIYGGRIINQDYSLVDRIRTLVFGDELYREKPLGTVTIFQNDVRISTNVLDEHGNRAIGTRVSEEVYNRVVEEGEHWQDRAFVVTHWYRTAYEPIRNLQGDIIGILYVGILEKPFTGLSARILLYFLLVIALASILAGILAYILAGSISKPITGLTDATQKMSGGQLGLEVQSKTHIKELVQLAESFNEMSARIDQRERSLKVSNEKLEDLNKTYLDLLGFVAHELKGLLASATMNAYSIRDGFLGMINFKQKRAVDSICRNLDYLDATVKKFLNLSRLERGNLEINKTEFCLRNDIFEVSIQTFAKMIVDKKMQVHNEIDPDLRVHADLDLMLIVANNLVNNGIKYGQEGGTIHIAAQQENGSVTIDVYNDGRPISEENQQHLFKKFSRLDVPEKKKVKGTGLGLYITKQIIEAHGGNIRVEPKEQGNSFIFQIERE